MTRDWSREEVEATISDYLAMLQEELAGRPYNKTEHRRRLSRFLNQRSDGAIERKHQNISAVLLQLGLPCIEGYKPLGNYQQLLFEIVEDVTIRAKHLLGSLAAEVRAPAVIPSIEDILHSEVPAPALLISKHLDHADRVCEPHIPRVVNYLAREAANQSLGSAGEEFVMRFETARLLAAGADCLADKIERVSVTSGDSAGFDVLSFEETGEERFIEVKTTRYGSETPFFVSRNEVAVSKKERDRYRVYRVFDFRHSPRFFQKCGQIDEMFLLEPAQYEARVIQNEGTSAIPAVPQSLSVAIPGCPDMKQSFAKNLHIWRESMDLDPNSAEFQFLRRQFERGDVVLFAGAGFSEGATNRDGGSPPLGSALAKLLSEYCGWSYQGDELPIIYEQAQKHLGTQKLMDFLGAKYGECNPGPFHRMIPQICWHRIYTTNIDDVLEHSYSKYSGQQRLSVIVHPEPVRQPDFFMETVQCIHLHGWVNAPSKPFTFTLEDFAYATAGPNPWYQALIEDMQFKTVLFIGTRLTESPFQHYLALRELRTQGSPDSRAKAFLVSPEISQVRRRQLRDQNIVPIQASADQFFDTLNTSSDGQFPKRENIFKERYPHQLSALNRETPPQLLLQFDYLSLDTLPRIGARDRSLFYMGAEPTWADIKSNIDAKRDITVDFTEAIVKSTKTSNCFVLTGYAGSGKTATLMRSAYELTRKGETVYYYKGEDLLVANPIIELASKVGSHGAFLFIDGAARHIDVIEDLYSKLPGGNKLYFVFSDRSHVISHRLGQLELMHPLTFSMPELNKDDTERILEKLEETGFLGVLQDKPRQEQINAFLVRAQKQLLVALREATSGRGFDAILAGEFESLGDEQAKIAYTVASLAGMHNAPGVRRRHLLACIDGTDAVKARVLSQSLKDVVVPKPSGGDLLTVRHRVIGRFVAIETAPLHIKIQAIERFLSAIAADVTPESIHRRSPEYIAYRGIVNFDGMVEAFGKDYEIITSLYETLKPYYKHDFLFWLQYGRAELDFNHFDFAEKDLNQSLAIRPESHQTMHHLGVLFLKKSYVLSDYPDRMADAEKGEKILLDQIKLRGDRDPYPYGAYLFHKFRFLELVEVSDKHGKMSELYKLAKQARSKYPLDEAILDAAKRIEYAYLMQAVKPEAKN